MDEKARKALASVFSLTPCDPERAGEAEHFLQSPLWARHKAAFSWTPLFFELRKRGGEEAEKEPVLGTILLLLKKLPLGFALSYVPFGPSEEFLKKVEENSASGTNPTFSRSDRLSFLAREMAEEAEKKLGLRLLNLRFDLNWELRPQNPDYDRVPEGEKEPSFDVSLARKKTPFPPFRKAPADIQAPDTVVLDLSVGAEALLAGMKPKTRYNIRLAEKKGVEVFEAGLDGLDTWYRLNRATAERDRIGIHSYAYYETLLKNNPDCTELFLARHEGEVLAGIVVLYWRDSATYLYGASSNSKRNLMSTYLLQWKALEAALRRGCKRYDFYGIPPTSDPGHPMHGLFQFKTGFGGRLVHYWGTWDFPVRKTAFFFYGLFETFRFFYHRKLRKLFFRTL